MHHRLVPAILWVSLTALPAQTAWDAIHIFEDETGFGTRALALGGAYTGLANDFSAVYWNPAGLGQIQSGQFYSEMSHYHLPNAATYGQTSQREVRNYTRFRSIGWVAPVPVARGSLVFALGYHRIRDFDENLRFSGSGLLSNGLSFEITSDTGTDTYPFDRQVWRQEEVTTEGGLGQWSLAGAVAVAPKVLVGATLGLISGRENYHLSFRQEDQQNRYNTFPGDFASYQLDQFLQNDLSGVTFKVGLLWTAARWIQWGGTIQFPQKMEVHETHSTQDQLVFDDGFSDESESSGQWSYTVRTPYVFESGLALRTPLFTATTSLKYRDWSQTRFVVPGRRLDTGEYRAYISENDVLSTAYRPTTELRAGAEIPIPFWGLMLRGGLARVPHPRQADGNPAYYIRYSAGLALELDRDLTLNLTGSYSPRTRFSADAYTPEGTRESLTPFLLQAGIRYRL